MADFSPLDLGLCDTPLSTISNVSVCTPMTGFSVDDFTEASPVETTYCRQLTNKEYEDQTMTETEKSLQKLIAHLESEPAVFKKLLRKRKQEQLENEGVVSFLKSKVMKKIQGEKYKGDMVTDSECHEKLEEVTNGMMMVYNYSHASRSHRYSKRLALKREQYNDVNSTMASPAKSVTEPVRMAPPPPPGPPPPLTPFKEKTNIVDKTLPRGLIHPLRYERSTTSKVSLHEELLSTNPGARLRSTRRRRSPGGTPARRKRRHVEARKTNNLDTSTGSLCYENPLDSSEPLSQALVRILEHKFRNVRSPSPAPSCASPDISVGGFTP